MGNLGSVSNMLNYIGVKNKIISTPKEIEDAEKLILPGVGNWDNGIRKLNESGLIDALKKRVITDKVPVLGICLGMQLLLESSEEGELPGLGWVAGHNKKFKFYATDLKHKLKVPHMGWNIINACKETELTKSFDDETQFYFVHSYHADGVANNNILMTCNYGYKFTCAVHKGNIWGVQFHPEKSHRYGMNLMKNFSEL